MQVTQTHESLSQVLGRSPTIADIAVELGVGDDEVIESMEAGQGYRSASLEAAGPEEESIATRLGFESTDFSNAEWRVVLGPHLAALPARDQKIVELRFRDGLTQSEIATRIGISQMHVSRLLGQSLRTLREACAVA